MIKIMDQEVTKQNKRKHSILGFIGFILILGSVFGGGLKSLSDWSSSELIGANTFIIVSIILGGYFIYIGLKK
jgi:hypothetical protein